MNLASQESGFPQYADTNSNQDIIDEARLYSAKMEKITNGVERNKDGSLNRPAIRKIATEANIPSKHQDIGMDQANATSGFNDILASMKPPSMKLLPPVNIVNITYNMKPMTSNIHVSNTTAVRRLVR